MEGNRYRWCLYRARDHGLAPFLPDAFFAGAAVLRHCMKYLPSLTSMPCVSWPNPGKRASQSRTPD
jgi:hypothetical protein